MSDKDAMDLAARCECQYWARQFKLVTKHHPNCIKYDPEGDASELIEGLLDGMDAWAADEDGVHPDAWEAYRRASFAVGRPVSEKEST